MNRPGSNRAIILCGLLMAASLWLSSCDTVAPGVFSLEREPIRLTFTFSGSGVGAGQTVTATAPLNLLSIVTRHNFTAGDVVGARIVSGTPRIEMFAPVGERLDAFASAELRAGPDGLLLASGSGFPVAFDAPLNRGASDIASVVVAGAVSAQLTLVTARALQNTQYSVDVRFDVIIDVEG